MADFSQRTTTENVTRHEWRLTLPSNWVELDKLLHSVKAFAEREHITHDNVIAVEADDEVLVLVHEFRWDDVGVGRG